MSLITSVRIAANGNTIVGTNHGTYEIERMETGNALMTWYPEWGKKYVVPMHNSAQAFRVIKKCCIFHAQ